jgi:hypothetical protein
MWLGKLGAGLGAAPRAGAGQIPGASGPPCHPVHAFVASGFEPFTDSSPENARRFVGEETARWTPIIKNIGLKLE